MHTGDLTIEWSLFYGLAALVVYPVSSHWWHSLAGKILLSRRENRDEIMNSLVTFLASLASKVSSIWWKLKSSQSGLLILFTCLAEPQVSNVDKMGQNIWVCLTLVKKCKFYWNCPKLILQKTNWYMQTDLPTQFSQN